MVLRIVLAAASLTFDELAEMGWDRRGGVLVHSCHEFLKAGKCLTLMRHHEGVFSGHGVTFSYVDGAVQISRYGRQHVIPDEGEHTRVYELDLETVELTLIDGPLEPAEDDAGPVSNKGEEE